MEEAIQLVKAFKLEEAEQKLAEIYPSLNTELSILAKCIMGFIKGEQNNTLEKQNTFDYLHTEHKDSMLNTLDHVYNTFNREPLVRLMSVCVLTRQENFKMVASIVDNLITSNAFTDKLHTHVMLIQADTQTILTRKENLEMYIKVYSKARELGYPRAENIARMRIGCMVKDTQVGSDHLLYALTYFSSYNDVAMLAVANLNIGGICYYQMKNYLAAEKHLVIAIAQFQHLRSQQSVQCCLYKLACIYKAQNKLSLAFMMFADLIQENKLAPCMIEQCRVLMDKCSPVKYVKVQ